MVSLLHNSDHRENFDLAFISQTKGGQSGGLDNLNFLF
ncbi:hypothetical protein ECRM12761_12450 [Escherichia coli O145:H28 str. RM12761]|nr:hypothetical protein ECRM13516_2536 [Escherichia coli O145:H28 str. RM13516]AHY65527.1 hypothetical protein ECRM12761_12450 [Escherichia coli O145:H28 str. RM12761]